MKNQSKQSNLNFESVTIAITKCNDINTLKVALLDTLVNMKATNRNELMNDLIVTYGLGKLKDIK